MYNLYYHIDRFLDHVEVNSFDSFFINFTAKLARQPLAASFAPHSHNSYQKNFLIQ